jgi:hypothetical protein
MNFLMLKKAKSIRFFVCAAAYSIVFAALLCVIDVSYARYFEPRYSFQEKVLLQLAETSLHRRSDIPGLFYELRPFAHNQEFKINSLGMRDSEPRKGEDSYRVLVMGDSVAFGVEVAQEKVFSKVAERLLQASGKKIEILNASVCGYNSRQEYIALKEKYLALKPDMVLFAMCANDTIQAAIYYCPEDFVFRKILEKPIMPSGEPFQPLSFPRYLAAALPRQFPLGYVVDRWLLLHSSIYRVASLVSFKWKHNIRDMNAVPYSLFSYDFNGLMSDLNDLSKSEGFLLRFFILPTKCEWGRSTILDSFRNHNIEFWDFDSALKRTIGDISDLCLGCVHLSEKGHDAVARLLVEKIEAEKCFKP